MSLYFASFSESPMPLDHPFWGMPMRESLMVQLVYKSYVVSVDGIEMLANLMLLDMVDFDIILNMDWCFVSCFGGLPLEGRKV